MTDRRITDYAVEEGSEADIAADIATKTHYGFLEGVEVDFRHPLLPVNDWHASAFWHVWSDGLHQAGVLFPSEASAGSIEELRLIKGMADDFPVIPVNAGDKLSVVDVEIVDDGMIFDHPHDREDRLAFLKITRNDGSVTLLDKPMIFHGATRLRNGPWRLQFDNAVDRIKQYCGQDNLTDFTRLSTYVPPEGRPLTVEEQAFFAAQAAHKSYFKVFDALEKLDIPERSALQSSLRTLANSAVMAAFLLGKVEARRADQIAAKTVNGGKRLGLANANQYWVKEAERLWNENPRWTLNKIAETISLGDANDKRSIMKARGVVLACPQTSPSWDGCQKKIKDKGW